MKCAIDSVRCMRVLVQPVGASCFPRKVFYRVALQMVGIAQSEGEADSDQTRVKMAIMTKEFAKASSNLVFGRDFLRSLKRKALRRNVWYSALSRIDRVLLDLTVKVADQVRGSALINALVSVIEKLESAFENRISCALRSVGFPLAQRLSLLAQKWGNKLAVKWVNTSFARFLAVMHLGSQGSAACHV